MYFDHRLFLGIFILLNLGILSNTQAQIQNEPYSFQHRQKYSDILYSPETRIHTAAKQSLYKGLLADRKDSLQNIGRLETDNWLGRKIFNEHLVQVDKDDHSFYLDFMPDLQIGTEMLGENKHTTWLNTRGIQVGLQINDKFSLYSSVYENQGKFANYLDEYMQTNKVMPGQGYVENLSNGTKDWMYATASMTYDFSSYFQATVAYDKNHIGDGYRSVLLSDFSSNYAQLKLTGEIGNIQYTSVWAYMLDQKNPRQSILDSTARLGDGIKWGAFQYLDWNATNRFSIGLFQAVVWANQNAGGKRGFDFNYLNPALFLRPVESNNSTSPDKMFLGFNAKYKIWNNVTTYGQFMLGEFVAKEFFSNSGFAHNKWGAQIGMRGFDAFGIKNLNFLAEYNLVRPYTYQHFSNISNYSNYGEPLAHPRGANFREYLGIVNYSLNRFDFALQGMYTKYGSDPDDMTNMGGDIFKSYENLPNYYGNKIGQGVKNNLYYADAKVAYVLNPKYNLRLELGYTHRIRQIENASTQRSGVVSFGLRSSFRNFYGDI